MLWSILALEFESSVSTVFREALVDQGRREIWGWSAVAVGAGRFHLHSCLAGISTPAFGSCCQRAGTDLQACILLGQMSEGEESENISRTATTCKIESVWNRARIRMESSSLGKTWCFSIKFINKLNRGGSPSSMFSLSVCRGECKDGFVS